MTSTYKTTVLFGRWDLGPGSIRLFGLLFLVAAVGFVVAAIGMVNRYRMVAITL